MISSIKSISDRSGSFHSPEETLARLNSHRQGLTIEEASERLKVYGRNEVAHEQVPPVLVQLLQAFNNPFIYVLMALAGSVSSRITGSRYAVAKRPISLAC